MRNMKSLTRRTVVSAEVGERGEVHVSVIRNGTTVERFELAREPGLGADKTLHKHDWGVEVTEFIGRPAHEEVTEVIVFEGETRPVEQEA